MVAHGCQGHFSIFVAFSVSFSYSFPFRFQFRFQWNFLYHFKITTATYATTSMSIGELQLLSNSPTADDKAYLPKRCGFRSSYFRSLILQKARWFKWPNLERTLKSRKHCWLGHRWCDSFMFACVFTRGENRKSNRLFIPALADFKGKRNRLDLVTNCAYKHKLAMKLSSQERWHHLSHALN